MCLIIYKPADKSVPADDLKVAFENNSDGYGVMFPSGGVVQVRKAKGTFEEFLAHYAAVPAGTPLGIHFRWRTSGNVDDANAHPFQVLSKHRHGLDLWLMHNGVLNGLDQPNKDMCDTWHYVEHRLKPILAKCPGLIRTPEFRVMIESDIGHSNKFLLMEGTGRVHVINRKAGDEREGCWYSNSYSLRPSHRFPGRHNGHWPVYPHHAMQGGVYSWSWEEGEGEAQRQIGFKPGGLDSDDASAAADWASAEADARAGAAGQSPAAAAAVDANIADWVERNVDVLTKLGHQDGDPGDLYGRVLAEMTEAELFNHIVESPDEVAEWLWPRLKANEVPPCRDPMSAFNGFALHAFMQRLGSYADESDAVVELAAVLEREFEDATDLVWGYLHDGEEVPWDDERIQFRAAFGM